MAGKLFLTGSIFLVASLIFISATKADDIPDWLKIFVIGILCLSGITVLVSALAMIWA